MSIYLVAKSIYHAMIPAKLRRLSYDRNFPFHYLIDPIKNVFQLGATHDELYDQNYFTEIIEPMMRASAGVMAESIVNEFRPDRVVDVGCGTGELLHALNQLGVRTTGFENSTAAIEIARAKGVEVCKLDLERPVSELEVRQADLAISTEVAEHIPERFAEGFVEYLCSTANTIVMTAAPPGQEGHDHVNLQLPDYWIAKFQSRNFAYDSDKTSRLGKLWKEGRTASCFYDNLMIFRKV